jgi:ribosomal protein S7
MKGLLRMRAEPDTGMSAVEVLKRTPLDQLEETVQALKKHRPHAEVRQAMVEVIARASPADFEMLKSIYLKHCGDAKK